MYTVDIFEKCHKENRADKIIAEGLYPYFQEIKENYGPIVKMNGKKIIMAGSNNYLGLSKHPDVVKASREAIKRFGTTCSGSRYLNGTLILHTALERELADYLGMESCLLFTTGFLANQGVLPTIVHKDEYLITDKDNHASIVAGTLIAKALAANIRRYKNNDMESLERTLKKIPLDAPKLIVSDGVFSMSGYVVNLPGIVDLAKKYNARVMLDEAHSIGVLGKGGVGTCSHFGLKNGVDVDLVMGTFSKSFASIGGFIAGTKRVIEYIKHNSQALIFSASMAPANVAAVHAALKVIKREPERVERINEISTYMRNGLREVGFKILDGITPIVPVVIGDDIKTFQFWRRLLDEGVFANAVVSPGVPEGMQLIRNSFIATHQKKHLDRVIKVLAKVGKELGMIS
jgi:8-amino-7-oxononanoate synthase